MNKCTKQEWPSLYSITGDIKDLNTVLVPVSAAPAVPVAWVSQSGNLTRAEKLQGELYGWTPLYASPHIAHPVEVQALEERDMLAQAIADAAKEAGIYNGEVSLNFAQLLMLLKNMAQAAGVQPVALLNDLHEFLDVAAGEGFILGGVDSAELYKSLFPSQYSSHGLEHPTNCGTGHCSCIECPYRSELECKA